ncbi:MAG TPA: glycoside hydrolase family 1 protein [Dictyoglomaceae bacterium]|nr:glycoside hydrolase family 1 protein [Dictyoglomaceae bacterium]
MIKWEEKGGIAMVKYAFPEGFFWGTATASHQVEGDNNNNDWWEFETQGRVKDKQISGKACDHWNRYEEDFDLIEKLHNNAYRFSIEWSRIEREKGKFDESAIEHYRDMLLSLRRRNIEPFVTLHHFTNPLWISREGGWLNEDTILYYLEYVEKVVSSLKDLVTYWTTINEPNAYAFTSYLLGMFPPQGKSLKKMVKVINSMAKAHGKAYKIIHDINPNSQVSIAYNVMIMDPVNPNSAVDRKIANFVDGIYNRLFIETLITGRFSGPFIKEDIPYAKDTLDYLGINYYTRIYLGLKTLFLALQNKLYDYPEGVERSDFNWEIYPEGFYRVVKRFWEMVKKPIIITENGISDAKDTKRSKYLISHLIQLHRAIEEGVDIRGYLHWSLMDNFEWADGFQQRFGLFEVDFQTQERKWRESAKIYSEIAKNNAISEELGKKYLS